MSVPTASRNDDASRINPLTRVVFIHKVLHFVPHNVKRVGELTLVSEPFQDCIVNYGHSIFERYPKKELQFIHSSMWWYKPFHRVLPAIKSAAAVAAAASTQRIDPLPPRHPLPVRQLAVDYKIFNRLPNATALPPADELKPKISFLLRTSRVALSSVWAIRAILGLEYGRSFEQCDRGELSAMVEQVRQQQSSALEYVGSLPVASHLPDLDELRESLSKTVSPVSTSNPQLGTRDTITLRICESLGARYGMDFRPFSWLLWLLFERMTKKLPEPSNDDDNDSQA